MQRLPCLQLSIYRKHFHNRNFHIIHITPLRTSEKMRKQTTFHQNKDSQTHSRNKDSKYLIQTGDFLHSHI
jgi:hypothetical protein